MTRITIELKDDGTVSWPIWQCREIHSWCDQHNRTFMIATPKRGENPGPALVIEPVPRGPWSPPLPSGAITHEP